MKKFFHSTYKEFIILIRDIEGLILLFFMPIALVIIVTFLQNSTFRAVNENQIPMVLVDHDQDSVGLAFRKGLKTTGLFELKVIDQSESISAVKHQVETGKYKMGIIIPEGTTQSIRRNIGSLMEAQLPTSISAGQQRDSSVSRHVQVFFDPITKKSFKRLVISTLNEFIYKIESKTIFTSYSKVIDALTNQNSRVQYEELQSIEIKESYVSEYIQDNSVNAVQHNVPAWTLFAMFFISVPLAVNIVKERDDGCLSRLKAMPVSYVTILMGKISVYILICLLQAIVIILIGIFVMPLLGMPALRIGFSFPAFFVISLASALAATGYGVLIGTLAKTHTQATTFGSVSVVILAALGGIWIPNYMMSDVMRNISNISPLNWGLQGYYDLFLRGGAGDELFINSLMLLGFFVLLLFISTFVRRKQHNNLSL